LNPIIVRSPRIAAMAMNKPYGEEHIRRHSVLHRIALRQAKRTEATQAAVIAPAEALREQTA
jgi:hypothetical protein